MNANTIVNMVMRIFMRKVINKGIDKGFDMAARRNGDDASGNPTDLQGRENAKRAKQAMKVTRRVTRL